ncbi:MAG: hypothetical protein HQL82_04965 [Magnetococcales bacterium]|nr:hypothetical protein [Magnetococcales bacterium]
MSLVTGSRTYPLGESSVVYIGASGRMRKRLLTHFNGRAHSEKLRTAISNERLNIRWTRVKDHPTFEAYLIHGFLAEFGDLPLLNSLKPNMK